MNAARTHVVSDVRRAVCGLLLAGLALTACGSRDVAPRVVPSAIRPNSIVTTPSAIVHAPIVIDGADMDIVELWPLNVTPAHQIEETRRVVEQLQAELTLQPGFRYAVLLASGDGAGLLLWCAWEGDGSADRGDVRLAAWLRVETDTALFRARVGTTTPRVRIRRTAGARPALTATAMVQLTRYVMKRGHSFTALAALADSNLAMRVLQDTSASGGATLMAADSGALYMLLQARNATALDPKLRSGGSLPFWAPFADRDEQLLAVVAVIRPR